jgi:hypothetical protein
VLQATPARFAPVIAARGCEAAAKGARSAGALRVHGLRWTALDSGGRLRPQPKQPERNSGLCTAFRVESDGLEGLKSTHQALGGGYRGGEETRQAQSPCGHNS